MVAGEMMRGQEQGADLLKEGTDRMVAAKEFVDNADDGTKSAIGLKLDAKLGGDPSPSFDRMTKENADKLAPNTTALLARIDFILNDESAPQALKDLAQTLKGKVETELQKDKASGQVGFAEYSIKDYQAEMIAAEKAAAPYDADVSMRITKEQAALKSTHEKALADSREASSEANRDTGLLQGSSDYRRVAAVHSENAQRKTRADENLRASPHYGPYVTEAQKANAAYQDSSSMLQAAAEDVRKGAKLDNAPKSDTSIKDYPVSPAIQQWLRRQGK